MYNIKDLNFMQSGMALVAALVIGCFVMIGKVNKTKTIDDNVDLPFNPKSYVVYRSDSEINIDGRIDDKDWEKAEWTSYFVEREESTKPSPRFRTRVKMLWDNKYFYFAAELEESDIWASMTNRNDPLYQENAFEIFIDPTGDTHNYFEFEINALNTIWDLFFTKPGRDGGYGISNWNLIDYKTGIFIEGELNNPEVEDERWSIEVALPFEALTEVVPGKDAPESGDQWRVNFIRMNWEFEIDDGKYIKKINKETGGAAGEYKWTWSPQKISMHRPETWGYVQFSNQNVREGEDEFIWHKDEKVKWTLRQVYYRQKKYYENNGYYSEDINKKDLIIDEDTISDMDFSVVTTTRMFEASMIGFDGMCRWYINDDGKVWKEDI